MTKNEYIESTYIPELLTPVLESILNELQEFRTEDYIELFIGFHKKVKEKEYSLLIELTEISKN